MSQRIVRLTDAESVAEVVASRLLAYIIAAQQHKDTVQICLTGGQTANLMYERFAELAMDSEIDPTRLHLWWGDERFVPATDPDRNSLQAVTRLARTLDLKAAQIHMMAAKDGRADAQQCAAEYEAELGDVSFDVTLLGVGPDGHVGSIFPNHPSFEATTRKVIGVNESPKPPAERITLTIPTLNRSSEIWLLVTGQAKADAVARALAGEDGLPASHVGGTTATYWFLDEGASTQLPPRYVCPA